MDILAFDIGGTQGRTCLAKAGGTRGPVAALQRASGDAGRRWLERLIAAAREQCAAANAKPRVVSVSFGGPVDNDGRILSMHVAGWESINLAAELKQAFGVPVKVENDANAGAVGEF